MLGINADPVTIKQVEVEIIDHAFASGWVVPRPSAVLSGRTVAVIGSGPAGLAAAQQLTRAGHAVTVFERDEAPGGLLRFGIPEFKLEKRHLNRRLAQMQAEGTRFRCGVKAGRDVTAAELRSAFDAIVLCGGARVPRDLPLPGRDLAGIHQAMEYLPPANRAVGGSPSSEPAISARGRRVVIIGGGDTGADCLGTAHRQGAASVIQLKIMPRPPASRPAHQPWPVLPDDLPRLPRAHRGRRRAGLCGVDAGVPRRRRRPGPRPAPSRRGRVRPRAWHRTQARDATWSCSPWASPVPSGPGCLPTSA